jgi:hypothetical protein
MAPVDAEPAPVRFPFPLPERFAAAIGDRGRFGLIGLSWGAGDELAVYDPDRLGVGVVDGGPLEIGCQSADDAAAAHRPGVNPSDQTARCPRFVGVAVKTAPVRRRSRG